MKLNNIFIILSQLFQKEFTRSENPRHEAERGPKARQPLTGRCPFPLLPFVSLAGKSWERSTDWNNYTYSLGL